MITIPVAIGCGSFVLLGLALLALTISQLRYRRKYTAELAEQRNACSGEFAEIRKQAAELEASLQNTRDVLRHGRFNRSTRAQALHLLRSGMSPETAASALGVGRRELRLLAKVAESFR
jgi:hypothetical protein